jgi:hypothetical protein
METSFFWGGWAQLDHDSHCGFGHDVVLELNVIYLNPVHVFYSARWRSG